MKEERINILFVCLGNICRSPSAEAIMKKILVRDGLSEKVSCDSAGILAYHVGEPADQRMAAHGMRRGYSLTSISRQFAPNIDFEKFDYIIAMDNSNLRDINSLDKKGLYTNKIYKMVSFCSNRKITEVPDPYFGDGKGFETVLNILEDGCEGLLKVIKNVAVQYRT